MALPEPFRAIVDKTHERKREREIRIGIHGSTIGYITDLITTVVLLRI